MERPNDNVEGYPIIADSTIQPHPITHPSCSDALIEVGVQNLRHERIGHPFVFRCRCSSKFMPMRQKMGRTLVWGSEWHLRPIYLTLSSADNEFKFSPPLPAASIPPLFAPSPIGVAWVSQRIYYPAK
jgi:hypothetical protein